MGPGLDNLIVMDTVEVWHANHAYMHRGQPTMLFFAATPDRTSSRTTRIATASTKCFRNRLSDISVGGTYGGNLWGDVACYFSIEFCMTHRGRNTWVGSKTGHASIERNCQLMGGPIFFVAIIGRLPESQAARSSLMISGFLMAIVMRDFAAPDGVRRPCSHS